MLKIAIRWGLNYIEILAELPLYRGKSARIFSNDYQIVIVLYKHFYSVYTNKKTDIRFELYKIKSIFVHENRLF